MRIAICGGTFDPFHRGHLEPVLAVRDQMGWGRVLFMPAYVQPFKRDRETASGYHRFAMAAMATRDHDGIYIASHELERGAVSYTVDTLRQLRSEHPDAIFDWIVGDDNLAQLLAWKAIDEIFELANVAVLRRSEVTLEPTDLPDALRARVADASSHPKQGAIVFASNPQVVVSSTDIRRRVAAGQPIDALVDPQVSRYIHHYALYRKGQA